jgi:hypothetical protein
MSARDVAAALGGHRSGSGYLARCPLPSHGRGRGDRNPSLSLADGTDRLLVRCHSGCDPRELLAELRARGFFDDDGPTDRRRPHPPQSEPRREFAPLALAMWNAATPIADTLADIYLRRHRGLDGPFPPSLRFAPAVPNSAAGKMLAAMVAAVQLPDRRIAAVQRTFLRPKDGAKAAVTAQRLTTGGLGGGAVRLARADDIIGLAEGVEDALSAMQLTSVPCWAALGAGRMHRVAVPDTVRELHIFADDDQPGRAAAYRTAERHRAEGRRVVIRLPATGSKDWNDLLRYSAGRRHP